jgi:hypothetical protein
MKFKGDSIKTPKKPRAKRVTKVPLPPVDLDGVEWRAVLTIHRANELTDTQRYALVNWLRAKVNELGNDEFGRNLASTYRARANV